MGLRLKTFKIAFLFLYKKPTILHLICYLLVWLHYYRWLSQTDLATMQFRARVGRPINSFIAQYLFNTSFIRKFCMYDSSRILFPLVFYRTCQNNFQGSSENSRWISRDYLKPSLSYEASYETSFASVFFDSPHSESKVNQNWWKISFIWNLVWKTRL